MKNRCILQPVLLLIFIFSVQFQSYGDTSPDNVKSVEDGIATTEMFNNEPENPDRVDSGSIDHEKEVAGDSDPFDTILNKSADMKADIASAADDWNKIPEDVSDGNPDHIYFYIPARKRWIRTMIDDPQGLEHGIQYAPFDDDADTGAYIRYDMDSGQWFSFAPFHEGKEVKIFPDEVQLPESVNDGNPDHTYYFDPAGDCWLFTDKVTGEVRRAPFDDDADTGAYIRYDMDSGQWFSFAPIYEGGEKLLPVHRPEVELIEQEDVPDLPEEEVLVEQEKPPAQISRKTFVEQEHDHECLIVPEKNDVTKEDIAKGKKSKLRFNFILDGWSFENFYRLVERSGFKILFIGNDGMHVTNLEVVGLDYNGKPVLEKRLWKELLMPTRGYPVESIPKDEEVAGWADYDDQIREEFSLDSSHRMHLFFPHHIKEILKKAVNMHYENLGETDSRVTFTIKMHAAHDHYVVEIEDLDKEDGDVSKPVEGEVKEPIPDTEASSAGVSGDIKDPVKSDENISMPEDEPESESEKEPKKEAEEFAGSVQREDIYVPDESEVSSGDTESGMNLSFFYDLRLTGWSFEEFFELVRKRNFKIFLIVSDKQIGQIEVHDLGSDGIPHMRKREFDKKKYSKDGISVVGIEGGGEWQKYEDQLNRIPPVGEMKLYFPYYFLVYLHKASKLYCDDHDIDSGILLKSQCVVEFAITTDYKFNILGIVY